jgi:hypothetical protein
MSKERLVMSNDVPDDWLQRVMANRDGSDDEEQPREHPMYAEGEALMQHLGIGSWDNLKVTFVPMRVEVLEATRPPSRSIPHDSPCGLVTLDVTIPGFIQRELLTHKRLSHSFVSSRSLSAERLATLGYYMPRDFYRQGPGMTSSDDILVGQEDYHAGSVWKLACIHGLRFALALKNMGIAKEQANRVMAMDAQMFRGAVTATESGWAAFFKLRCNDEGVTADRAMSEFARMCRDAVKGSMWLRSRYHTDLSTVLA